MRGKSAFLPGEICRHVIDNRVSNGALNRQKSAEAVVVQAIARRAEHRNEVTTFELAFRATIAANFARSLAFIESGEARGNERRA